MNGVITNDAVFSRFTFALLEDSGYVYDGQYLLSIGRELH